MSGAQPDSGPFADASRRPARTWRHRRAQLFPLSPGASDPQQPQLAAADGNILTVALVDDHQTLGDLLTAALHMHPGLRVLGHATSGRAGIALVRTHHPDVVLLDNNLPDLDGLTVASRLTRLRHRPRILLLTADHNPDLAARAELVGIQRILVKDGSISAIIQALHAD